MHYEDNMLNIVQMDKGEKLYYYTTNDALLNIVRSKEFWITKWNYLNDMDELKVALDVCEAVLMDENVNPELINKIKKDIDEIIECDDYYILSFSCDYDSQLLWSNYSNFGGINLEIDSIKI